MDSHPFTRDIIDAAIDVLREVGEHFTAIGGFSRWRGFLLRLDRRRWVCKFTTDKQPRPVEPYPYRSLLQPHDLRDLRGVETFHIVENQDQSIARRYAKDGLVQALALLSGDGVRLRSLLRAGTQGCQFSTVRHFSTKAIDESLNRYYKHFDRETWCVVRITFVSEITRGGASIQDSFDKHAHTFLLA